MGIRRKGDIPMMALLADLLWSQADPVRRPTLLHLMLLLLWIQEEKLSIAQLLACSSGLSSPKHTLMIRHGGA
jgi:hypothetical protein